MSIGEYQKNLITSEKHPHGMPVTSSSSTAPCILFLLERAVHYAITSVPILFLLLAPFYMSAFLVV